MSQSHPTSPPNALARRLATAFGRRRARRTSILAIDLEGTTLHAVHAALRASDPTPTLLRQGSTPLPLPDSGDHSDPTVLGPALRQALKSLGLDQTRVIMAIPRTQTLLRALSLPAFRNDTELAAMVHFQIGRDLPFRPDESWLDFHLLEHPATSTPPPTPAKPDAPNPTPPTPFPTRVLAAVVRRDAVDLHRRVATAAGLDLDALGLRSVAVARAAVFCEPSLASGCHALVSLRNGEITFDVLVDGAWLFGTVGVLPLPTAPTAPNPPTETASPEPTPTPTPNALGEAALTDVVRGLHAYEALPAHPAITSFLVIGTTGVEPELAQRLQHRFALPARTRSTSTTPEPTRRQPTVDDARLAALGLALGALESNRLFFDFLQPKLAPKPRDTRRVRRLAAVAGVLALLVAILGFRAHLIRQRDQIRLDLQQQLSLASKNLPGYRAAKTQARTLTDWTAAGRNWLDHLAFLAQVLPPSRDLYLTSVATSPRNVISLSARVRTGEVVDRLGADLRTAGYSLKPPAITPVTDRFGFRFQVNLEIEIPKTFTNTLDLAQVENRASPPPSPSPTPTPTAPPPDPTPRTPAPPGVNPANLSAPPPDLAPTPAPAPEDRPFRRGRRRPDGGPRE